MYQTPSFRCKLEARQCQAQTKKGEQCKRRTRQQLPYCYEHTRLIFKVDVRPSTIADAGLGLFALQDFKKGDKIVPYEGEIITEAEFQRRYGEHPSQYALQLKKHTYVDGTCVRGVGSLINTGVRKKDNNAKFSIATRGGLSASVKATKAIREGHEIFVDYGDNFLV